MKMFDKTLYQLKCRQKALQHIDNGTINYYHLFGEPLGNHKKNLSIYISISLDQVSPFVRNSL